MEIIVQQSSKIKTGAKTAHKTAFLETVHSTCRYDVLSHANKSGNLNPIDHRYSFLYVLKTTFQPSLSTLLVSDATPFDSAKKNASAKATGVHAGKGL